MARRRNAGPGVSFFAFQDIITAVVGIFILITLILVLELAQRVEAAHSEEPADAAPVLAALDTLEDEVRRLRAEIERRTAVNASSAGLNAFNREEQVNLVRDRLQAATTQAALLEKQRQQLEVELSKSASRHEQLLSQAAKLAGLRQATERLADQAKQAEQRRDRLSGDDSPLYRDQVENGRYIVLVTMASAQIELRDALTRHLQTMQGGGRLDQLRDWLDVTDLGRRHLLILIEPGGAADFGAIRNALDRSGATYGFSVVGRDHAVRLAFEVEPLP